MTTAGTSATIVTGGFSGSSGLNIHLGRKAGTDDIHPDDADERDPESFESYPATEDGVIIVESEEEAEEISADVPTKVRGDSESSVTDGITEHDSDLMEDLRELRNLFLDDDEKERTVTAYHAYERLDGLIERHSASK